MKKKIQTIGVVAPSFFVEKYDAYKRGIKTLQDGGYHIIYGNTVNKRYYNTTGTAINRARDINGMFADSRVDMIIATDGGCRAEELVELLDYDLIKKNPKPICGFSDITHLLLAIYTKTNIPVIHGMDIINGFGEMDSEIKRKNISHFWNVVYDDVVNFDFSNSIVLKAGKGKGVMIGGWLNAIEHLAGSEFFPSDKNLVLLWEAIDEEPNRINMMLQSLKLKNILARTSAMVIGELSNCQEKEYFDCIPDFDEMILEVCSSYNFPIIKNASFGHKENKQSFRFGKVININTEEKNEKTSVHTKRDWI